MALAYRAGRLDSLPMIPAIFLVLAAVLYRVATGLYIHEGATWLSNFAPLAALALCSAAYLPSRLKFSLPLGSLLVSDLILNSLYGASLLDAHIACRYLALVIVGLGGLMLQRRHSLKAMLPASIGASVIFYVITNAFSWLSDPGYTKTAAGLWQALTIGLPQYAATPAWMFFRNSLLSDLLFTFIFVLCFAFSRDSEAASRKAALARAA
jgi:uncharacterized protein DUF6580